MAEPLDLAAVPDHAWLFAAVVGTVLSAERDLRPYVGELAPDPMLSRTWGSWLEIPHPSLILRQRSERGFHRLGELYDQMVDKDFGLAGLWEKRVKAVLALPHQIRPADSSPLAQQTADFVRAAMDAVPLPIANLQHNLGSILKGVAITEVLWEQVARGPLAGAWLPVDLPRQTGPKSAQSTWPASPGRLFRRKKASRAGSGVASAPGGAPARHCPKSPARAACGAAPWRAAADTAEASR